MSTGAIWKWVMRWTTKNKVEDILMLGVEGIICATI